MTVLSAYKKPRPKPAAAPSTVPLNPGLRKGDQALAQYLKKLYGPIASDKQLGRQAADSVSSQIDPVLAEIARSNTAATTRGSSQIRADTGANATRLAEIPGQVHQEFSRASAEDQQAADALSSFLRDQGQTGATELTGKLTAAGAPDAAIADVAGGAAALGQGAGGEAAGRGYATRAGTIGRGAGEAAFAETMPGIARLEGGANLAKFEGDQAAALADARGQVTSQVPGIVSGVLGDLRKGRDDTRAGRATAIGSFLGGALDRNTQAEIARAGLNKDVYGINVGAATDTAVADTRVAAAAAKAKAATKTKQDKAHKTALGNMETAKVTAGKAVASLAQKLTKATHKTVLKQTSKFAPPVKVQVPIPPPDYSVILAQVMQLPEVTVLGARYGVRPNVLQSIVMDALKSAGVFPGYKMKPIGPPRPPGQPGKKHGEPPG